MSSITSNPIQTHAEEEGGTFGSGDLRKRHTPSAAYLASMKKAMSSNTYTPPDSRDGEGGDVIPGWKSFAASGVLLITGIVIFITGAVFFWGSTGTEKHSRGKDLLIVGGILLLPGSFSSYIYLGAWMRWRGFKYSQVPSLHLDDISD